MLQKTAHFLIHFSVGFNLHYQKNCSFPDQEDSWGKINGESETEGIRDGGDRIGAIRGDRLVMSVPRSYHVSPRAVSHN